MARPRTSQNQAQRHHLLDNIRHGSIPSSKPIRQPHKLPMPALLPTIQHHVRNFNNMKNRTNETISNRPYSKPGGKKLYAAKLVIKAKPSISIT